MKRSTNENRYLYIAIIALAMSGCDNASVGGTPLNCENGYTICGNSCCDKTCINDLCYDLQKDTKNCGEPGHLCESDEFCSQGTCHKPSAACPPDQEWCNGSCVNLQGDPKHCGDCTTACQSNESCKEGHCTIGCASDFSLCPSGICVDLTRDSENCGACGNVCGDFMLCQNSTCVCQLGHHDCDNDSANGCESIRACHIDTCEPACLDTQTCIEGTCIDNDTPCDPACLDDQTCIAGTCVETVIPCKPACLDTQTCIKGACIDNDTPCDTACLNDQTCIAGICIDNDAPCEPACLDTQTCIAGRCIENTHDCLPHETMCYGKCFDLANDNDHCGNCLNACAKGEHCIDGTCELDCKTLTLCDGACFDTSTSKKHCSTCGHACAFGEACVGAACRCDDKHYDCDGISENGCESTVPCACTPNATQKCWRGDTDNLIDPSDLSKGAHGICEPGSQICDASGRFWGPCTGGTYPSALSCDIYGTLNGLDNDCDGKIDTVCRSECDLAAGDMSYIGCEYWGAYLDNLITDANSNHTFVLSNPNEKTANVYIFNRAHATATTVSPYKTVTIAPHDVVAVEMHNTGYNMSKASGILPNAYKIRADIPITAYQFSPLGNPDAHSNDASLLLPANVLGSDYIGMTWISEYGSDGSTNDHRSYIAVIATEPGNTAVTVTTTSDITATETASIKVTSTQSVNTTKISALAKGATFTYTLPQYSVLTLMAPVGKNVTLPNAPYNQTGTRIHADKNIAVFGASRSTYVPTQTETSCCRDHIEEQLLPTQAWGKSYFAARAYSTGKAGDFWLITAKEDNTTVILPDDLTDIQTINKVASSKKIGGRITLNAGETFPAFETRSNFEIHADKPISVGQFLPSKDYNGLSIGDPSFILTVPYEQYRSDYDFMVPTKFDVNYITIITPKDGQIEYDGKLLKSSDYISFTQLGTTDFYVAYYKVQPGVHHIVSDKPFGLYSYGYYNMSSYGYPIGLDLKVLNTNSSI